MWALLPLTAGPALAAGLDPRSGPVRDVASVLLWLGWAAALVAMLVPSTISLTLLRLATPAALAATAAAALTHLPSTLAASTATVSAAIAVAVAYVPETALLYVNGRSYPNERRLPLRSPGPLAFGPLPLAWALTVGGPMAAVLLLAAHAWIAGALIAVISLPTTWLLGRALHGLSRRWVVFVPAGLVLHDPITLLDPVLFELKVIESIGPAPAGSDSLDLTQGSRGLALELLLKDKVPMTLSKPGTHTGESGSSARLLFTPSRPGLVLQEADARRIPLSLPG
ncbi:MAG: hypothetical protein QOG03_1893 [Actinomycetota bacterium]|nr:hypothetical protein [Actinomycetota bacterium]